MALSWDEIDGSEMDLHIGKYVKGRKDSARQMILFEGQNGVNVTMSKQIGRVLCVYKFWALCPSDLSDE